MEPIAIIGIACRFPGAAGPPAFWRLLCDGVDAIAEIPPERWDLRAFYDPDPAVPGKMNTRWGGFLEQVDQFDPQALWIAPREAARMDPQQRLLLEVAWEALEDAGQLLERLEGTRTGVFVGISTNDYSWLQFGDPALIDAYANTGNALSIAANRLSFVFNFRGPSMAIDSACSSSLVAVHLACQSLWSGESTLALAGGVNLILAPEPTIGASKLGAMASDGRCKTFDARADGYVRGEGAGIVVLKPLAAALADGDPLYAVIRGGAVGQDGRTNGLTAPSRQAQEAVLREAYQRAGVAPGQVHYVEAHGTGTLLGDPIEAKALGAVLAAGRPAGQPCAVGSVKTNIGHLEAAAGIAGLIKVALALKHHAIPPSLHFHEPNPHIPFDALGLRVQQNLEPWLERPGPALAGVSSFGFGGTNAHIVLEEVPRPSAAPPRHRMPAEGRAELLPLSARDPAALTALARAYYDLLAPDQRPTTNDQRPTSTDQGLEIRDWGQGDKETRRQGDKETRPALSGSEGRQGDTARGQGSGVRGQGSDNGESQTQNSKLKTQNYPHPHPPSPNTQSPIPNTQSPAIELHQLCYTASVRRSHHDHRLALVACSHADLAAQLAALLRGDTRPGIAVGQRPLHRRPKLVLVFSGQGGQWAGMGRELLSQEPVFRAALERCDEALRRYVSWSALDVLTDVAAAARFDDITVIQPVLFAFQVALAALWRAWGIVPDAVVGHSMGEVAAAHVAGALNLDDAAHVICRRSQVLGRLRGQGGMALVELPAAQVQAALAPYDGRLAIAASNSPTATVVAGASDALAALLATLRQQDIFCRQVQVDAAAHSPQVAPLQAALEQALVGLEPRAAALPIYSTVSGARLDGRAFDAAYWGRNLREPVQFATAVQQLLDDGHELFLEISPHPVLASAVKQGAQARGRHGQALASLRRGEAERATLLASLGALYTLGQPVNWGALYPDGGQCVPLPSYPWQRARYWLEPQATGAGRAGQRSATGHAPAGPAPHPLPDQCLKSAVHPGTYFWEFDLGIERFPYLADHRVEGAVVLPAALMIELALAAASAAFGSGLHTLEQVAFTHMLVLPQTGSQIVQLVITQYEPGAAAFQLFSRPADAPSAAWVCHANGTIWLDQSAQGSGRQGDKETRRQGDKACPEWERRETEDATPATQNLKLNTQNFEERSDVSERQTQNLKLKTQNFEEGTEGGKGQESDVSESQTQNSKLNTQNFYAAMQAHGLQYGPGFQSLTQLWRRDGEALGHLRLPDVFAADGAAYQAHPALLDGCFQLLAAAIVSTTSADAGARYLPVGLARLCSYAPLERELWGHAQLRAAPAANMIEGDLVLQDATGAVVLEAQGLRLQRIDQARAGASDELNGWLYQVAWRAAPHVILPVAATEAGAARWLIFADRAGAGQRLRALLEARGARCVMLTAGAQYERMSEGAYQLTPAQPTAFRRQLQALLDGGLESWRGVVHLWSLDAPAADATTLADLETAYDQGCGSVLHLVQMLAQAGLRRPPRLWLVTQGVQVVGAEHGAVAVAAAPLWGFGRTLAQEQPELRCTNVDLGGTTDAAELDALGALLWADEGEDQVALRSAERYVARLVRCRPAAESASASAGAAPVRADVTYLIAGGLGGLGLTVARWLVERGARQLVLVSRGAPSEAAQAAVQALAQAGARVVVARADVADVTQLAGVLADVERSMPPLRGVVHAAGVLDDGLALHLTPERFQAVLAPKVRGAWNLHVQTRAASLEFFVLFSSAAALLGAPGQGNYAAANAFLDALAAHRRALGLPALSIDWGPWAEVGLAAQPDRGGRLAGRGMVSLAPAQGLAALNRLLGQRAPQVAVMNADWPRLIEQFPMLGTQPLLSELVQMPRTNGARQPAQASDLMRRLAQAHPGARRDLLVAHIQREVAAVLGLDPARPPAPEQGFFEMGMDSLMAVELIRRLQAGLAASLPSTLVFEYASIAALADYLARDVIALEPPEASAAEPRHDGVELDTALAKLEQLSEDEAEALLVERLTKRESSR